jgi:hypothetical protein
MMKSRLVLATMLAVCFLGVGRAADEPRFAFSWDRVPLFAHLGKLDGPFTDEEIDFLATKHSIVVLEKSMEMRLHPGNPVAEAAIERAAARLKERNPKTIVLGYWNLFIAYPFFNASKGFFQNKETWGLKNLDGTQYLKRGRQACYDLSNPELREWWMNSAVSLVGEGKKLDGIFIDAIQPATHSAALKELGPDKVAGMNDGVLEIFSNLRLQLPAGTVIAYNGAGARFSKWEDRGLRFAKDADIVMMEHFIGCSTRDAETGMSPASKIQDDWRTIDSAVAQGKTLLVKAWPKTKSCLDRPGGITEARAREELEFPLACFLLAAGPNCFFLYNWGYTNNDGQYIRYDEYDKPLGPPKGPRYEAQDGSWERDFEHAHVWANPDTNEARITWRKPSEKAN